MSVVEFQRNEREQIRRELDMRAVESLLWTAAWMLERSGHLSSALHADVERAWAAAGSLRREVEGTA